MFVNVWEKVFGSICSISFISDSGIKLNSVTGFRIYNCIVTDEYIYKIQKCEEVIFQFVGNDGFSVNKVIRLSFQSFTDRINRLVEFEDEGFALIDFDEEELKGIPSLEMEVEANYRIGEDIAVVGYHLDQDNLCIKKGIISSFFKSKTQRRYIQFDAAIKQGNSGSPLINQNGKVIGVVGYRLSALTKSYEAFKNIIDENLKVLKKSEGKLNILDVDPIQVLIANQNQLKQISKEFYKSATMTYGYAHLVVNLPNYIKAITVIPNETSVSI